MYGIQACNDFFLQFIKTAIQNTNDVCKTTENNKNRIVDNSAHLFHDLPCGGHLTAALFWG